jgi:hypothetical protein
MRSPGTVIVMLGVVLGMIYVAVSMLLLPSLGVDVRDLVGPTRLWPALALNLGGVIACVI